MQIEISNVITIRYFDAEFERWLSKKYTIPNPEYITRVRLNKWTWNCPKTIKLYKKYNQDMCTIPYGCLYDILEYALDLNTNDVSVAWRTCPDHMVYWGDSCNIVPRDYQAEAIDRMVHKHCGILKAPCSSGKTVMGHMIARKLGVKTLWLTHTKDLLNQSKAVGELMVGKENVGTITDGKVNIGGTITYATVQTMAKFDITAFRDMFSCVIVDECFPGDTEVTTQNGNVRIDTLTVGDAVASYNVESKTVEYKKITHLFKNKAHDVCVVSLSNGDKITCTKNHPFYTSKGEWINAEKLCRDDYVLRLLPQGFDECRVESVEIQEQTSDGTFGGLCEDGYVYNVEVEDNNNYFANNVLVHNCHRCSTKKASSQMSYVVNGLAASHKYGLSATPETYDGYGRTILCNLGNIEYRIEKDTLEETNNIMPVDVHVVNTGWEYPEDAYKANGTVDFQCAMQHLYRDEERNKMIAELIADKPTLILSNNIDHLVFMLNALSDEQQEKSCLLSTKHDESLVTAFKAHRKHGAKDREKYIDDLREGRLDIMFATYQLAKEGLNIPRLSQVIMAFPAVDHNIITQTIGRVARTTEGKTSAVCYDLVDSSGYFRKKHRDRLSLYKKNGNKVYKDE